MSDINWDLIERLAGTEHPLIRVHPGLVERLRVAEIPVGVTEVLFEARAAHHLLDMMGIPNEHQRRQPDVTDLDARVYRALRKHLDMSERLSRISTWHSRETGPGGMVGDYCQECETKWPCDTRRMADGEYDDAEPADEMTAT